MPDSSAAHKGRDIFPQTMSTWIDDRLGEGSEGREALNRHVMSVYADPLRVYYLGTSYRRQLGDPDDVIQGFFASRLDRPDFLEKWSGSGLKLRRWLMNALLFYLREQIKQNKLRSTRHPPLDLMAEPGDDAPDEGDAAWAVSVVRSACVATAAACEAVDQKAHWDLFFLHRMRGRSYLSLAQEFDITPKRASVMVRTVERKFRDQVRRSIMIDGVPEDQVDGEIRHLLEVTR